MRTLTFLCGYGDFYFKLANMTAHTIRLTGHKQDIVIFTTSDKKTPYARCINLATHPESNLIITPKKRYFHHKIPKQFGHKAYDEPYDYFIIKTLPGTIINRKDYDFILFLDSDMLIHSPMDPVFKHKTVVSGYNGRSAYKDVKSLRKYLTPKEIELAKRIPGIGGGLFGVPSNQYSFFDDFREVYLKYIHEIPHDQPALSFTQIRHYDKYTPAQLPNKMFWAHYWGNRKQAMLDDYQREYANRTVPRRDSATASRSGC